MRPIYESLINRKDTVNFRMPGHKQRINWEYLNKIDVTETYDTDNLHDPEGIIKESLDYVKGVYKTKESLFVVNGSTSAIQIAVLASTSPGDEILVQRNSHMASYHSLVLGRLRPTYFSPKVEGSTVGQISVEEFKETLEKTKARVVLFTYPSFEGYASDLGKLIELAHSKGMIVIVDEAHGAHLTFTDRLIPSAIELGADLVIESVHKTLPALTQTSLLHINSDRVNAGNVHEFARIMQTSSPSYVFMESIERAVDFMDSEEGRKKLDKIIDYTEEFHEELRKIPQISMPKIDCFARDITRFHFGMAGYTGDELGRILYDEFDINVEYTDYNYIIGIVTVLNEKEDFDKLLTALREVAVRKETEEFRANLDEIEAEVVMNIADAFYAKKKTLPIEEAVGKISGGFVIPYPPGIVLIAPGERIKKEHMDRLNVYKAHNINVLNDNRIEVIDE